MILSQYYEIGLLKKGIKERNIRVIVYSYSMKSEYNQRGFKYNVIEKDIMNDTERVVESYPIKEYADSFANDMNKMISGMFHYRVERQIKIK